MKEHLILDIDGTLLFADEKPASIVIKGRRRNSYMARETIQLLREIQESYNIVLATGRSLLSVQSICKLLAKEGVYFKGAVAENGGLYQKDNEVEYLVSQQWMHQIKEIALHFDSMVQLEFTTCLALLRPTNSDINKALDLFQAANCRANLLRDGNKIFFLSGKVNKRNGLTYLLGEKQLSLAAGVGNDINDLEWLKTVRKPAAPACAGEKVLETVTAANGIISKSTGHKGIAELLAAFICK